MQIHIYITVLKCFVFEYCYTDTFTCHCIYVLQCKNVSVFPCKSMKILRYKNVVV